MSVGTRIFFSILCVAGLCDAAPADGTDPFVFSGVPRYASDLKGFDGLVRINGLESVAEVTILYSYRDGRADAVQAKSDKSDASLFHFTIPPAPQPGPGEIGYHAEARYGVHGTDRRASATHLLPLSLMKELDITGDAAKPLLFPIGTDAYTVRYIPCCNIFGGTTYAERVNVCPEDTKTGLPEKLLSDFVVLKPDGLSASTMGLYFDFALGSGKFDNLHPALYEFNGKKWVESQTYEVDAKTGHVSIHCPEGGSFVVGIKQ